MTNPLPLTLRQSWKALQTHHEKIRSLHLRTLFADDTTRGERLTAEAAGIIPELESETDPALGHDSSTNTLIRRYRRSRNTR